MAKVIVVYDVPDPSGLLEGEQNEQERDDLQNWLTADMVGVSSIDSDHPQAGVILVESVRVVSESEYGQSNRSVWVRGAN